MRAALLPADDAALDAVASPLCASPVDPPGIRDHAWLQGGRAEVVHRLRLARDDRLAGGGRAWVVQVEEIAVGYLSARVHAGGAAETFTVVARSEQGRGIGLAARRLALDELASAGFVRAISVARPASASAAISRRLGYELRGTEARTHPDGHAVVLERYELLLPGPATADSR